MASIRRGAPGGLVRRDGTALLARLIESRDLTKTVQSLPERAFSTLIRRVGVEDAGELVALATTEQLVAAFDEDLFTNDAPGQRETFDVERFGVWLEILLEAGDAVAAKRVAELPEAFVVRAVSGLVLVLDQDELRHSMDEGGEDARLADKAMESALSEELDRYLVVGLRSTSWDAVLSLLLALDRDHRDLLERVLERCAELSGRHVEDLAELTSVLSAEESLAEDVEAEREERRAKHGYVEPQAAKGFLTLARQSGGAAEERDAITKAYFRNLDPEATTVPAAMSVEARALLTELSASEDGAHDATKRRPTLPEAADAQETAPHHLLNALRSLAEEAPDTFDERMAELTYLANVLMAGGDEHGKRLRQPEAMERALSVVALGVERTVNEARDEKRRKRRGAVTHEERLDVLRRWSADLLFRRGAGV